VLPLTDRGCNGWQGLLERRDLLRVVDHRALVAASLRPLSRWLVLVCCSHHALLAALLPFEPDRGTPRGKRSFSLDGDWPLPCGAGIEGNDLLARIRAAAATWCCIGPSLFTTPRSAFCAPFDDHTTRRGGASSTPAAHSSWAAACVSSRHVRRRALVHRSLVAGRCVAGAPDRETLGALGRDAWPAPRAQ